LVRCGVTGPTGTMETEGVFDCPKQVAARKAYTKIAFEYHLRHRVILVMVEGLPAGAYCQF
jgi:hypothetical protein